MLRIARISTMSSTLLYQPFFYIIYYMLLPHLYGTRKKLTLLDEQLVRCPACEKHSRADIMINSEYFHIYYLPIFPTGKDMNIICHECGMKRFDIPLDLSVIHNGTEMEDRLRHPWYLYSGILIVVAFILFLVLKSVL